LHPNSGSILVDGQEIVGLPERDMVPIRARMAMVFQGSALFDSLSVRENVGYRLYEEGALSDSAIERLLVLSLCFVGLEDTLDTAYRVADRLIMVHRGEKLFDGTVDMLKTADDPRIRTFLSPQEVLAAPGCFPAKDGGIRVVTPTMDEESPA